MTRTNEAKKPTSPDDLVKPVRGELKQSELDEVAACINFVKMMDKASPQL